ncbi:MAG: hypothetical protein ACLQLH_03500 [Terracidiphilus sp.]
MLQNVADITRRIQALLDNPSGSKFNSAYILPFIDQEYDEMDLDLERLGMQYVEQIAIFNIAANITDLTYAVGVGQPLQYMKLPKRMDWKLQGVPDIEYQPSNLVTELDDVDLSSEGVPEWRFASGGLQITPSSVAVTLRVYFDAVSTDIYDPAQNVIRGTAHILALRAASTIAAVNNGLGTLQKKLDQKRDRAWTSFCNLVVMNDQQKRRVAKPTHTHGNLQGTPVVNAPTS